MEWDAALVDCAGSLEWRAWRLCNGRRFGPRPELREQIFNPFFTSKKDGVGLGLSIVAKIVDDHRGTIRLDSDTTKGARFRVFFPQAAPS